MDRFGKSDLLDAARISRAIEFTRFPVPEQTTKMTKTALARTANPIGKLEDPNYLRKANALYYEFDEVASASDSATLLLGCNRGRVGLGGSRAPSAEPSRL
jgi:hypothetical protein